MTVTRVDYKCDVCEAKGETDGSGVPEGWKTLNVSISPSDNGRSVEYGHLCSTCLADARPLLALMAGPS